MYLNIVQLVKEIKYVISFSLCSFVCLRKDFPYYFHVYIYAMNESITIQDSSVK